MSSGLPVGHEKYKPFVVDVKNAEATFGDVNFIEHGGQLLVKDADGDPYLEVVVPPEEGGPERWTIYRVTPERLQVVEWDRKLYLVDHPWLPDWPGSLESRDEWFHKHLEDVADQEGIELQELRRRFCSESGAERAMAYIAVAAVHGWHEFDQYPLRLTEFEVHTRYGEEPPAMKISLKNQEQEQGHVTAYCADPAAALHDQSIGDAQWEAPGDLDVAYAVLTDRPGLVEELEDEGYEVDTSDYCAP